MSCRLCRMVVPNSSRFSCDSIRSPSESSANSVRLSLLMTRSVVTIRDCESNSGSQSVLISFSGSISLPTQREMLRLSRLKALTEMLEIIGTIHDSILLGEPPTQRSTDLRAGSFKSDIANRSMDVVAHEHPEVANETVTNPGEDPRSWHL